MAKRRDLSDKIAKKSRVALKQITQVQKVAERKIGKRQPSRQKKSSLIPRRPQSGLGRATGV